MRKFMFLFVILSLLLTACGTDEKKADENKGEEVTDTDQNVTEDSDNETTEEVKSNEKEEKNQSSKELTLPDGFPSDFPLPNPIVLTKVSDDSDEEVYSFYIEFTFDPNLDLEATFQMYRDYVYKLGYNVSIDGEEQFAEGIIQYGAYDSSNIDNMFVVTLKPAGETFGSIKISIAK